MPVPNLTQETLSRRDAAMRTPFSQAAAKRSIYERVIGSKDNSNAEARIGLMQERLSMQQQQNDFSQRMAEKEQKLRESIDEFHRSAAEQKLDDTNKVVTDAVGFLKETAPLRKDDPFFDDAIASAIEKYPDAVRNPIITDRIKYKSEERTTFLKAQQEQEKLRAAKAFAEQKNLPASKVVEQGYSFESNEPTVTVQTGKDDEGKPATVTTTRGVQSQMAPLTPISPDELFNQLGIIPKPALTP